MDRFTKGEKICFALALFFAFILTAVILYGENYAQNNAINAAFINQAPHDTGGFGVEAARVDSQITLKIPLAQADEVYQYLRQTYCDSDETLKKAFPGLKLTGEQQIDVSDFTDEYFDTPNLDLYRNLANVRHRKRINTTNPNDAKSGRQLVQMKLTPSGDFAMRSEVKFDVETKPLDAGSKRVTSRSLDADSRLLRTVKESQRPGFKDALKKMEVNPYSLRSVFTLKQTRSRVYLDLNGENVISFSVDQGDSEVLWAQAKLASVDVGILETVYTPASEAKRKQLVDIREFLIKNLQERFPDLEVNNKDKYNIILDQIREKIPGFDFLFKWRLI